MSFTIKRLDKSERCRGRVERLLWAIDSDYVPPLSTHLDLSLYAEKLLDCAVVCIAEVKSSDVGIIAIYTNEMNEKLAFISTIGVSRNARGIGVAGALIEAAIMHARLAGMLRVRLEVSRLNTPAIQLYQKMGFKELLTASTGTYENSTMMEKAISPEDNTGTCSGG